MIKKITTLVGLILIVACSPTPTAAPLTTSPNSSSNPLIDTAIAAPQDILPTVTIQSTVASAPETPSVLWLQILSPVDEAVVNTSQVDVIGSAPAGAVISVNDEIFIVSSDLQFKATVLLDEGPNLIEVIASDESGNEMSALLTITYEP